MTGTWEWYHGLKVGQLRHASVVALVLTLCGLPAAGNERDGANIGLSLMRRDGRVMITDVVPGSPAAIAGLRSGDVIRDIQGQAAESLERATALMQGHPGTAVIFRVQAAGGEERTVSVAQTMPHREKPILGFHLETRDGKVVIAGVLPGSPADGFHLAGGEVIHTIQGVKPDSREHAVELLRKAEGASVYIGVGDAQGGQKTLLVPANFQPSPDADGGPAQSLSIEALTRDFQFTSPDGPGLTRLDCGLRPILFLFFTNSSSDNYFESTVNSLSVLGRRFAKSHLCLIPVDPFDLPGPRPGDRGASFTVFSPRRLEFLTDLRVRPPHVVLFDRSHRIRKEMARFQGATDEIIAEVEAVLNDGSPESRIPWEEPPSSESLMNSHDKEVLKVYNETAAAVKRWDYLSIEKLVGDLDRRRLRYSSGAWPRALLPAEGFSRKRYADWLRAVPDSKLARLFYAGLLYDEGWKERGGETADTVSDKAWKTFAKKLSEAKEVLQQARKLPGDDTILLAILLSVELHLGGPRLARSTYDQAVSYNPDYQYYHYILASLLVPKWYGSPGAWEAFARRVSDKTRERYGDEYYTRIANHMTRSGDYGPGGERLFAESSIAWPRMRKGYEDMLRRSPDSWEDVNLFARYACLAKDRETAGALFERINGRYYPWVWGNIVQFRHWENWAKRR